MEVFIIITLTLVIAILTILLVKFKKRTSRLLIEVINKMNYLNIKIDKLEVSKETNITPEEDTVRISESILRVMENQYRIK